MKSSVRNIMLIVGGIALVYLGISGMIKDLEGNYIVLGDAADDSSSVFYLLIGVLLLLIAIVSIYKEYMANKINRKRFRS